MGDFLNSKLVDDLKNGILPPVKVEIETESIIKLVVAGLVLLIIWYILRNN